MWVCRSDDQTNTYMTDEKMENNLRWMAKLLSLILLDCYATIYNPKIRFLPFKYVKL